jgi:hypothetical protein
MMMDTKKLTFGIISALFFAAIYSSSAQIFAVENSPTMSCSYTKDKKTAFCSDNDPTNNDVWRCDKQKNGTWKCGKIPKESGPNLPTDLKKGLSIATESSVNVTKSPNSFNSKVGNLLEDKNQVTNDEGSSNSSDTG